MKIFSTIEPYELTKIMDAVKPMEFKAGTEIIKEVYIFCGIFREKLDLNFIY